MMRNLGIINNYQGCKIFLIAILNFITVGILIVVKPKTEINFCFLCSGGGEIHFKDFFSRESL